MGAKAIKLGSCDEHPVRRNYMLVTIGTDRVKRGCKNVKAVTFDMESQAHRIILATGRDVTAILCFERKH